MNVGYKNHPLQKHLPSKSLPVFLKTGSAICACVTILPGITIGENSMVAGVPAKVIRKLE